MRIALSLVACFIAFGLQAGGDEWMTDLAKAQEKAKAEKKLVFIDFTGSDWCGWCIRLDKEVFSTKEFKDYAKDNLVLVEVDFPRKKQLSADQKKANDALAKKYNIEGFPTIIVLTSSGKKAGQLGYMRGGAKPFINELNRMKKLK